MTVELFDLARPRHDVLEGTLNEAVFAASLEEVVQGTAPDVYGKPDVFFANTYPSAGLRTLLEEALGRVSGKAPDRSPVIRLETSLGGGKTHNLIALYHAARGRLDPMRAMEFMDPGLLPQRPVEQLTVFVGVESGATSFPPVAGITPSTVWGYLALQLGGAGAYERVREDDQNLTAPGAHAFREVFGNRPTLILIDEIARYLAVAEGRVVGKSTLAEQTTAFLMALMEAVAGQADACLVLTTTQVTDAFGDLTAQVLDAVSQAHALIARKEHVLSPSAEADLPRILARRLFERVDMDAAESIGRRYAEALSDAYSRGADLSDRVLAPTWAGEVSRTWPFHPDLVSVLDKRLSTIPNFHRTRGALRLLARAVRQLWQTHPENTWAIHLHHLDLADADLAQDLSSRLDKAMFEPVIRADVASQAGAEPSHAEQVDAAMGSSVPYARRLATTVYLYSLTRDVPGVPGATLLGSVLTPGDDPNVVAKALDNLSRAAWYLHTDARGYLFSTEASLTKLIQEAEQQVAPGRVRTACTEILAGQFRDAALKVRRTWEDAKIPDRDDDAWLVVVHWDEFGGEHGIIELGRGVPAQVRELWEKTPAGGLREYRNRLVFLAPSAGNHDAMLATVRRQLALKDLHGSPELVRALADDKRRELGDEVKQSELLARIAVCNHVNLLFVPQAGGLDAIELATVTTASVKQNQTDAVLDRLAAMEKTLAAGDKPLDPAYIKAKLGARLDAALPTIELVRIFAARPDLKLVLDRAKLTELLASGVKNGVWEYHDTERGEDGWATKDRPAVAVRLDESTVLYPIGSAPAVVPVGVLIGPGIPGGGGGGTSVVPATPGGTTFTRTGSASAAVQQVREEAAGAGRVQLVRFAVSVAESGRDGAAALIKLHSLVPASTQGATIRYDLQVVVDLGQADQFAKIEFHGPPAKYQPLKQALDPLLRGHDANVEASLTADFDGPLSLSGEEVEAIRLRAVDSGPAKCTVVITTEASP